jgi:hypothetical protein
MQTMHRWLLLALVSLGIAGGAAQAQATTCGQVLAGPMHTGSTCLLSSPGGAPLSAPPEFGRCIKTAGGGYENASCTKLAGAHASYEWYPAFGSAQPLEKVGFTDALKELTTVTLETVTKAKIVCEGESAAGEYTGNRTLGHLLVTFTKCNSSGVACQSAGAGEETIVTNQLEGELGVEELGAEASGNRIGEELFPVGHSGAFAEFTCGGIAGVVTGSVISPVASNAMKLTETVKFKATKGKQKPESFVGEPTSVLTGTFGEGTPEQAGLTLTTMHLNEEKLEVNSVF